MSKASRVQMSYIKEVTPGVTPNSAFTDLRMTSDSLNPNATFDQSEEIRQDRQTSDFIQTAIEAAGDINFELSFAEYDTIFESALFDAFTTPVSISATDISAANSDNSYNSTSTDFTAQNISVGQWIKVGGFANAANNSYIKVTSVAANKLIVSGSILVTEAAGPTATMKGSMLRNGVTATSLTLEKRYTDITQFAGFTGMQANNFELTLASRAKAVGKFGFLGFNGTLQQAAFGNGSYTASQTNAVMSVGAHVKNVRENATVLAPTVYCKTLSFSLNNNIEGQDAVGEIGLVGLLEGNLSLTGQVQAYFQNETLVDKFTAKTDSKLDYRIQDAAGNAYVFSFNNINYTKVDLSTPGNTGAVFAVLDFGAKLDSSLKTFQIDKIAI